MDLEALKALHAASTPGEWRNHFGYLYVGTEGVPLTRKPDAPECVANREFIAQAHQAVPALIAEVERLQALLREASPWLEVVTSWVSLPSEERQQLDQLASQIATAPGEGD